jgi:hypothetical protein
MTVRFQCYLSQDLAWWRLVGSNNRALAHSAAGFDTAALAFSDIADLLVSHPHAHTELANTAGRSWSWRLLIDGQPRAISAAMYSRRIECLKSLERFRTAAIVAEIPTEAVVFRAERLSHKPDPHRL